MYLFGDNFIIDVRYVHNTLIYLIETLTCFFKRLFFYPAYIKVLYVLTFEMNVMKEHKIKYFNMFYTIG